MAPGSGSFVVEIEPQGRMPPHAKIRRKKPTTNEEVAGIADGNRPRSLTPLSAANYFVRAGAIQGRSTERGVSIPP